MGSWFRPNSHARKFFVRPYEYETGSFILFHKEKFRLGELPYKSTTKYLQNLSIFRKVLKKKRTKNLLFANNVVANVKKSYDV